MNGLPKDTVKTILCEYIAETELKKYDTIDYDNKFSKIISKIVEKRKLPIEQISSIIYSYKYENISDK